MPTPPIVSRPEWGAAAFKGTVRGLGAPRHLVVHHAAGYRAATLAAGKAQVKEIQRLHQGPTRRWSDIGYHFLIDAGGHIYQGRPFYDDKPLGERPRLAMGAHVLDQNSRKVGICLLGCFHPPETGCHDVPTPAALASLRAMLAFFVEGYGVPVAEIKTHRDFLSTSCPGDTLYAAVQQIRADLAG